MSTITCVDVGPNSDAGLPNNVPCTAGVAQAFQVDYLDDVECTITNTRKQSSIELKKVWVGAAGTTKLDIGTTAGGEQVDRRR